MSVAIFGKVINERNTALICRMIRLLKTENVFLHRSVFHCLQSTPEAGQIAGTFSSGFNLPGDLSYFFSVGGDGTFLESIHFVRNSGIPIVGVNSGRLGFLATIAEPELQNSIERLMAGRLPVEERSLLDVGSSAPLNDFPYALNDVVVQKKAGLVTVHVWCNDEFLNSYWADGLIIATPTGSSAYSMSVGGPIVAPESKTFIISPIAPHNLTVRPLVIPDNARLRLKIDSRMNAYTLSLDSRSYDCTTQTEITVKRANFTVKTVNPFSFYSSLRNKLMWGEDKRN
ncbi:MAG: NAD kinase [Bacteroidales bacterium]|jgi:NAD+ kinase|nr:NAD kinase [Bacteroidales bacterium]